MRTRTLLIWVAPAVVASLVLFIGLGAAQAEKHVAASPVKGPAHSFVAPHVGVAGMKITGSLVAVGFTDVVKASGFAVDSPQTLKCKALGGCTFEATMMVQFDSGTEGYAPGRFAICLFVDGVPVADCLIFGVAPENGFYTPRPPSDTRPACH